jgi:hypothetical protein
MTAKQQACEEHVLTHTTQQQDGKFVVTLLIKMEPNDTGTLTSLQSKDHVLLNSSWNDIHNSRFNTIIS